MWALKLRVDTRLGQSPKLTDAVEYHTKGKNKGRIKIQRRQLKGLVLQWKFWHSLSEEKEKYILRNKPPCGEKRWGGAKRGKLEKRGGRGRYAYGSTNPIPSFSPCGPFLDFQQTPLFILGKD